MFPETNLPWWRHDRPWGFRFSLLDVLIVTIGVVGTIAAWQFVGPFALFIPFLFFHFFLFCNTFRIGGERSLIWAFAFLANVYFWALTQSLVIHLVVQLLITTALVVQCMTSKNYHGLACERINPNGFRDGARTEGAMTRRVLLACRIPKPIIEIMTGRRLEEFDS